MMRTDPGMLDSISAMRLIKEAMPVVCSEGGQFAVVDHMEYGATIKLAKDGDGKHHYIPLTWVTSVDDKVHIDRPGDQAMTEWSRAPLVARRSVAAEAAPRHVNSVDATTGQPIVARVLARTKELAILLSRLDDDDVRGRGEIGLALSTVGELLTGDLMHVPTVVAMELSRWLEANKHIAETAVFDLDDAPTGPIGAAHPATPAP